MRRTSWIVSMVVLLMAALIGRGGSEELRQYRAYWVDTWNSDITSPAQVDQIIANVQRSNCNLIMAQVRRRGDAFFPSPHEPWCVDANTAFDSLDYLIKKAHAATPPIEVHAYMVTVPIFSSSSPTVRAGHAKDLYPQFFTKNNTGTASTTDFDPGHPDCLKYTADVYLDVVNRYDVDGIHYDYIRWAGDTWGYNDQSVARYNAFYGLTGTPTYSNQQWKQWRRDQVTGLARQIYARTLAATANRAANGFRPWMRVTSATITWGNGPGTNDAGWTSTSAYSSIFQDWRSWMQEGILDVNMPMTYYRETQYPTYYDNWIEFQKNNKYNRHLSIGLGNYLNSVPDTINQIREGLAPSSRGYSSDGITFYSYESTNSNSTPNSTFYDALSTPDSANNGGNPPFATKVLPPSMPWKETPTTANLMGGITQPSGSSTIWADSAIVVLTGPVNRSQRADGDGFYAFIDLPAGTYSVTASKTGVGTQTKSITIANGEIPALNFHLGGTDTTPPVISGVGVIPNTSGQAPILTDSKAVIVWNTDEPADSQIEYGLTSSYGSVCALDPMLSATRLGYQSAPRGHVQSLCGLKPGTIYHYRVISRDSSGNVSKSGDYTFTTLGTDSTAPGLSDIRVSAITGTSATITWSSTELADSQVEYGPEISYGQSTTVDSNRVYSHTMTLTGLIMNTGYHFRVKSSDAAGNQAVSWDVTFTTSNTDPNPPIISGVQATNITTSGATITWVTDEPSSSQVEYGPATGGMGTITTPRSPELTTNHSVTLSGLVANQDYRFRVISADSTGNQATSAYYQFQTLASDTTPPTISEVQAINITTTGATITWSTNEGGTSQVDYGVSSSYGSSTTPDANYVTSHSMTLAGLSPNTLYHYRVRSADASGNTAFSPDYTFRTVAPDTTVPALSGIQAGELSSSGATIHWSTDEPASSRVEYGITQSYGSATTTDATLVTTHAVTLSGLAPGTMYFYRVISTDAAGNTATSPSYAFTTISPQFGEIIIDNVDSGFQVDSGVWSTGTFSTDRYGSDYRWADIVPTGSTPTRVVRWTPNIPVSGRWQVWAYWPQGPNRPINSPYRIYHKGGSDLVRVNQQINGGQWNYLGTYPMEAGTDNYVTMSNNAEPTAKVTMADAVRFVPDVQTYTSPAGFVRDGWTLLSIPAIPENADPLAVLSGVDVPSASLQYWNNYTDGGGYISYGTMAGWTGPLTPGTAYWLRDLVGQKTISFKGLESVSDFKVSLNTHSTAPYWIMLGHPFNSTTPCSNITFSTPQNTEPLGWEAAYYAGLVEPSAQCFKGSSYVTTGPGAFQVEKDCFEPWYGYWLLVRTAAPITITIPAAP